MPDRRSLVRLVGAVAVVVAMSACSSSSTHPLVLDGRPRYPSTEGVVTEVSVSRITIDGNHTYMVSKTLQCFSTASLQTQSLLQRKGQYVQIGLKGDTMVWLASVAAVVRTNPPVVFYNGTLSGVDAKHRAVFRDGTVLRLSASASAPVPTGFMRAEIDPATHLVRRLALP